MHLVLGLCFLFLSALSFADEEIYGAHCGTRGNLWGTIASDHLIPDYFPPENPVLRAFFMATPLINLGICEEQFTPAHLGASCLVHDECYNTLGATKDNCDRDLQSGWMASCEESYSGISGFFCKSACMMAVNLMYGALRFRTGSFCPSCEAFERAQKRAATRT
jgi:hypothetical protein